MWDIAANGENRAQGSFLAEETSTVDDRSVGRLLRAWRARIDRRTIRELRDAARRSSPRLTQADMGRLTGVSEGWYRALESGQCRNFSDQFLTRVAQVLQLNDAETLTLFLGVTGRRPPADMAERQQLNPEVQGLLEHQAPHPAYLSDSAWNIVAANKPMTEWFPWLVGPRANLMRWALLAPEAREQTLDWEDNCARVFLAMLRVAVNRDGWDSPVGTLLEEILSQDPDCRRIWDQEHEVVEHRDGHRYTLRLPIHDYKTVEVACHVLLPIQRPDLRVVVLTRIPPAGQDLSPSQHAVASFELDAASTCARTTDQSA
ncbi:helix-turn-helix transcriptional regulator [Streptomyces sp. NPDC048483]|uniref:helix-turn-helix transcriptional regulator n=1 Tax=Streptomyces sp. NPDC048483 TaxID=3154927 RepID=UPI003435450A